MPDTQKGEVAKHLSRYQILIENSNRSRKANILQPRNFSFQRLQITKFRAHYQNFFNELSISWPFRGWAIFLTAWLLLILYKSGVATHRVPLIN